MKITFYKLSGAGNDFIGISNMDLQLNDREKKELTKLLCPRRTSVGADGTLFIEPSKKAHFTMRYYNADGSEAETCGNGARCIARLAYKLDIAPAQMSFITQAGQYSATIINEQDVRVSMSDPTDEKRGIAVKLPNFQGEVDFINTGVPHVVTVVSNLEKYPVKKAGNALRYADIFQPSGTNANFISLVSKEPEPVLRVRTYERGVEDETLACGTGCIASALMAYRKFHLHSPVKCITQADLIITVYFKEDNNTFKDIQLQGPAVQVFRGEYHWQK